MTAAIETARPSDLLRRVPPHITPAAAPRDLHMIIEGELAQAAHAGIEAATQRAALSVVLAQGYGLPKILATWWLGDGVDDILEAEYQASLMQAGDAVRVEGYGQRMRYHDGALAIMVGTVRRITPLAERGAARRPGHEAAT